MERTRSVQSASDLEASANGGLGILGKMTVSLKGLDNIIQKMQALAAKPEEDPALLGYIGGLGMVQMMGQVATAPDGKPLRNYMFEFTPDGKTLLNGVDIKMLVAGMTARGQQQGEPPVPAPTDDGKL